MASFNHLGYTYDLFVRPWRKGKAKYEALKWKTGFRNFWERISYDEFVSAHEAKKLKMKKL